MRKILQIKLKILARLILKKYRPKIVGITGSIGKSSAKEAIFQVLKNRYKVRTSYKNYNNEIGLPLSIIGIESPGRNYFAWLKVIFISLKLIIVKDKNYPEVLVLEMGIDRPNDMSYLLTIVRPDISVVTAVSHSHLEYFGTIQNIKKEKQALVEALPTTGLAVLNFDNALVRDMVKATKARVVSYGIKEEQSSLRAQDIVYNFSKDHYDLSGINFKLSNQASVVPVVLKNVISEPAIYAALAALAVASELNISTLEAVASLRDFSLPPGRMNVLPGIKHSFIIDDSYNSSPEAALSAVDILGKMTIDAESSKYAVMGDMLEIGNYTEEGHQLVGKRIFTAGTDYLIAVGERARDFMRGAKEAGMSEDNMFYFDKPFEAGRFVQNRLKEGDLILVKGSQGARMEIVVKELMAEPEKAGELLVRQGKDWDKKLVRRSSNK